MVANLSKGQSVLDNKLLKSFAKALQNLRPLFQVVLILLFGKPAYQTLRRVGGSEPTMRSRPICFGWEFL
jgi:hypothetical protein